MRQPRIDVCLCHLVWKPGDVEVACVGGLDNLPIVKSYLKGVGYWLFVDNLGAFD